MSEKKQLLTLNGAFLILILFVTIYTIFLTVERNNLYGYCEVKLNSTQDTTGSLENVEPGYIECCTTQYVKHKSKINCEIFKYIEKSE